ncbi:DUF1254 domain-containing protein [Agromyces sp. S2-1-8]|uniref:DUF1254 domain-containing protein n=1 Tax=Agromyces sp. S2-1-8 TaxID=2897180 RepID=UPI001E2BF339|nr:DUF1254 domain-containing protein [Agromyces sp. S2-1-8]MCD5348455.1 DUF1254 domain-containing protein [Agromyces sp. S2-1-8]
MPVTVSIDDFARIETDTMISRMLPIIGGLGVFHHDRELAPLDQQPVIRQNRDTLYSVAVVDLGGGPAKLTIPDVGYRYISVMVINQDHYINRVFHEAGTYDLTKDEFDTDYVVVAARILFDPTSEADLAEVHRLQDGLTIDAAAQRPFEHPDVDAESYGEVRGALLVLGRTMGGLAHAFGRAGEVDPVRHLVGTALGWGGLPDAEASYLNVEPRLPRGRYTITFGTDVPADAFWSLSVYNGAGYFEPGPDGLTNVNSVFAARNADGSTTVHLGDWADAVPNRVDLPGGWNLLIRLYRPRLDELATWSVPDIVEA